MSLSNHNQSSLLLIRSKAMRTEVQPLRLAQKSITFAQDPSAISSLTSIHKDLTVHQFNNSSRLTVEEVVTEPILEKKTKPFTKISSRWKLSTPLSLRRLSRQFPS
ncbi:hypothetical protein PGT21_014746 [Puccinia graminis f. sp. tritici]|uniref:Uncharacterized protein n=1 Tax=Puccinia graminis f. sp. tritici TaxID=56615 RepID=A0A5B0MEQ8_PUCGR|nr:hypothetical protein PGT21_014746 [Puccinia graminis f. sp. tritici]